MAEKDLVYRGKSKDVIQITEGPHAGKYRFVFEDCTQTAYVDGKRTIKNRNQVSAADFVNIFL